MPVNLIAKLGQLARAHGVQTAFYGVGGLRHDASPETLIAVLSALGAPVATLGDVSSANRARHHDVWNRFLEPVVVAGSATPTSVDVRLPALGAPSHLDCSLTLEGGSSQWWTAHWPNCELIESGRVGRTPY